jgi:hypothetical protein
MAVAELGAAGSRGHMLANPAYTLGLWYKQRRIYAVTF